MEFDFSALPPATCYKLLVAAVVPRPIALVSTLSADGVVNAAPFSFFNLIGDDPPIVIVSVENRPEGPPKDTRRNIDDTGEFVVNLVDEAMAERMHACSQDFPPGVSEPAEVGFALEPSQVVKPPRIADAPFSLECRLIQRVEINPRRLLAIGQVVWLRARDGLVDPQTMRVDTAQYHPVGRLYADRYIRTRDSFSITSSPHYLEMVKKLGRL
jgi:flavin reductase (DIM6/NTAB) family NADH-FMN oxidoreductase RutF